MSRLTSPTYAIPAAILAVMVTSGLLATQAAAYTAYITNEKDNTLSVIDTVKSEVIKTVKIGQRPRGIIMSKDGK